MDTFYFFIRYIPWWATPSFVICCQFTYTYWVKDIRRIAYIFICAGIVNLLLLSFYIYAGGPNKSVRLVREFLDI